MKFAQLLFRVLCLAVAVLQFGVLVNKALLEVDSFATIEIEITDSDFEVSNSEDMEQEILAFSIYSDDLFFNQDIDSYITLNKITCHTPSRRIISETQSVPYSPPELEV